MDKVYVVTAGSYSEYHMVTAFSSKEQANEFAAPFSDFYVEEITLDLEIPEELHRGLKQFFVEMKRDGHVRCSHQLDRYDPSPKTEVVKELLGEKFLVLLTTVWARDVTHAIKIANEKRLQILALGSWMVMDVIDFLSRLSQQGASE